MTIELTRSETEYAERELLDPIKRLRVAASRLERLVPKAAEYQWLPGQAPRSEQVNVKAKGSHGDPTARVALDDDRLRLRESVADSIRRLTHAAVELDRCEALLASAIRRWEHD